VVLERRKKIKALLIQPRTREAVSGTTSSTLTYMSLDVAVKRWLKVVNFSTRIEMKPNHSLDRQRPARYGVQFRKSQYSLLFLIIQQACLRA
jgi:hypothetical protein